MKKIFLTIGLITITMLQTTIAQRIKGSDTVLPLAQKESESYMKARPGTKVTVTGGGSGVGIAALINGTTDIAMASRNMKFDEKAKIQQAGKVQVEKIIAYDALAVVVHPSNKVSQLTRKQLEDIFTGKITNWKQVGGADMSIVVYSRETSSGTYEFFKEHVMLNKNYKNSVLSMPATGAIIQSVS
ncbi:MAG: phosphate ABC transporter substrate-binding protein, partial [Bacteroidales bacterium]